MLFSIYLRELMKIFKISTCQVSLKTFFPLAVISFLSLALMNHLMHCTVLFQKHKEISSIFFYFYFISTCILLSLVASVDLYIYSLKEHHRKAVFSVLKTKLIIVGKNLY